MEYENSFQQASKLNYDCLIFDIDDTLYPLSSGLSAQVTKNIQDYMLQKLGIEEEKVPEICLSLYKQYGTTMAGLRATGYKFDYDDFHGYNFSPISFPLSVFYTKLISSYSFLFYSFVHGRLPYEMLKPDPVLRSLLLSLPVRKVIFTNADKNHAAKVLHRLGLQDCFEGIISFETLNSTNKSTVAGDKDSSSFGGLSPVVCKPSADAFERVFEIANINPQRTLFFDDSIRNIQTGKHMGLHTVLVGTSHRTKGADYALESIHNIREALPELWEAIEKSEKIDYSGKIVIETSVTA
ncbi:hypothetical protein L1049_014063 [Liquidambar formosana]|uniref:Uncharacterized protein n=1 Tax=Liquidambar formosana TaxID=63359 RepID=A0AAP0WUL6_LIQFO